MRIAYLARRPIPSVHAHSVQIVEMCEAFGRLGHEVVLFAVPGDDGPATVFSRYGVGRRFEIETFPKRLRRFKKPRFVAWLLRRPFVRRADVFFGRDIVSLAAASLLGRPVIYEAHAIPPANSARSRILSWLTGRENFSHLVCVTSTLARLHRERFPALAGKPIIVAPNAAATLTAESQADAWPGRAGALQVGFAGRPFPGKGIEMIVAAARELADADFHVVGASVADLDWITDTIPPNVRFHGYQPHGKLGGYFHKFDVAVAPYGASVMNASRVESSAITSPLKLLEYMAAGLPSVVSDLPGVRDIVGDCGEEVAILVPPGDERAFSDAIRRLAADQGLRQEMGRAAHARYLERHTVEARAKLVLGELADATGD